ncbi:hypothetical protein DLJ53_09115 [Acuticoccus sediminis]|uniref:Integrase catalytic domain-containing protein n=1 Tax=Acuticoccus sediminis TaxID=2184697 RepID=A0A8B2NW19_9HYPH|nr:hypothetical protein DLJ53_09115 [Acuticoccus sediminis]
MPAGAPAFDVRAALHGVLGVDLARIAARPNQVWLADLTYIPTGEGWLFLAAIIDTATRSRRLPSGPCRSRHNPVHSNGAGSV